MVCSTSIFINVFTRLTECLDLVVWSCGTLLSTYNKVPQLRTTKSVLSHTIYHCTYYLSPHLLFITVLTIYYRTYYLSLYLPSITVLTIYHCSYYLSLYLLFITVLTTYHRTYYLSL